MSGFRITERSIATNVMSGLQNNIARLADLQNKLSSGKEVTRASDSKQLTKEVTYIAPPGSSHKRRTSEPSSAITSGSGLIHFQGNSGEFI